MKVMVGLGNPGPKYEKTRHNAGFIIVEKLQNYLLKAGHDFTNFSFIPKHQTELSTGRVQNEKLILAKPQTYMNDSGRAISSLVNFYKINPEKDLFIIYDDIDLPLGKIRSTGKSAGGHKGMESIINSLNTSNIQRFRIGILGKSKNDINDTSRYVLKNFSKKELAQINSAALEIFSLTVNLF